MGLFSYFDEEKQVPKLKYLGKWKDPQAYGPYESTISIILKFTISFRAFFFHIDYIGIHG